MNNNFLCTIFTLTYNRAYLLMRLYNSLREQKCKNFEWLIVDDGSTDNTEEVIKSFQEKSDNGFDIVYIKTKNGGKHRAINKGLDYAQGEVFAIVDSDDFLTADAVEKINIYFEEISNKNVKKKMAGIAMQKGYNNDRAVGNTFKGQKIDAKTTERRKYHIEGDKFEIFYTEVLKNNMFPEIENEKFMTEAIVWTRIARAGYYLRWYNDIVYICEYQPNGLTDNREKLIKNSPKGYALYIKEQVEFGNISIKQKLGYYSFYYNVMKEEKNIREIANELNTNALIIKVSIILRRILRRNKVANEKK